MGRTIRIASSSFLLPKNSAWRQLSEYGDLSFSDYGDYAGAFHDSAADETLVFILFAQDLLKDPYSPSSGEEARRLIEPLLSLISSRLEQSAAPTIVAVSSWIPMSTISSSRTGDACEMLGCELWSSLHELRRATQNLFTMNLDRLLGAGGFTRAFDSRNWYFAHCRLSQTGLSIVGRQVATLLERIRRPRKKVLVLDCDNTLWGGIVGEDGLSGLELGEEGPGAAYLDFQRSLRRLSQGGVLLTLCSKNNQPDVWEVFDSHASMALRRDDVASARINWQEKSVNLSEMAEELGLSLDSFVYWDDNPIERDMVRNALPMVEVVDVPEDVTQWPQLLSTLDSLQALSYTEEDRNKASQYRTRASFSRHFETAPNKADFLKSIEMVPSAHSVNETTVARAHQLALKTNQFNLRTTRYTREEILALAQDARNFCFLGSLSDRYGEHGIVALVICRRLSREVAFLDTFLMSCRVLGRYFEAWMLASLVRKLESDGARYLIGEYLPTPKNEMCASVLADHNFAPLTSDHVRALNLQDLDIPRASNGVKYIMDVRNASIPRTEVFLGA
jgi:FkbH-like protein